MLQAVTSSSIKACCSVALALFLSGWWAVWRAFRGLFKLIQSLHSLGYSCSVKCPIKTRNKSPKTWTIVFAVNPENHRALVAVWASLTLPLTERRLSRACLLVRFHCGVLISVEQRLSHSSLNFLIERREYLSRGTRFRSRPPREKDRAVCRQPVTGVFRLDETDCFTREENRMIWVEKNKQ